MDRYTVTGSGTLESMIAEYQEIVVKEVLAVIPPQDLRAIILGGGYGRGEGGVFIENGVEKLFNDFDYFIICRNLPGALVKSYQRKLEPISEKLTAAFGIDVDFSPLQPTRVLPNAPFWLIWYELRNGHRVIWGNEKILQAMPNYDGKNIPLYEGMKLFLNRGVGLLLAKQKLHESHWEEEREFIARNLHKAALAIGDVILMMGQLYHFSYVEREKRVLHGNLPIGAELRQLYGEAVRYKLQPYNDVHSFEEMERWYGEILMWYLQVLYQLSSAYLQKNITDSNAYKDALSKRLGKWETPKGYIRNLLYNCRDFKLRNINVKWYLSYPRERLLYLLPFFMGDTGNYNSTEINKILCLNSTSDFTEQWANFLQLWKKYN